MHNVPDLNSNGETELENIAANINQKLQSSAKKCYREKEFVKTPAVLKINTRTDCSSQLKKVVVNGKSGVTTKSVKNKNVKTNLTSDPAEKWDYSKHMLFKNKKLQIKYNIRLSKIY